MEEDTGDEWYEETWFYIVCGVAGGILLCCLCILIKYAHGDSSGRGDYKPSPIIGECFLLGVKHRGGFHDIVQSSFSAEWDSDWRQVLRVLFT